MTERVREEGNATERLADDLSRLLSGHMTEREFRETWQRSDSPPVLETIWGNLEHYLADADIRARDAVYREMQDAELRKLIRALREGGQENSVRRITFLGNSGR